MVEEALSKTFMDRESFYEKMLKKLPASPVIGKLQSAVDAGDVKAVFEASHELKGVYATLGLTPLYTACCEIVETARAGSMEGVPEKMPALQASHKEFLDIITAAG